MPRCVAIGCNEYGKHIFPKDLRIRRLWEKATKIRNFKASNNSRLCSKHFKETDYQGVSTATGLPQVHRYLKKTAVPSIFSWNKRTSACEGSATATSTSATARHQRYLHRSARKELFPSSLPEGISAQARIEEHAIDVQVEVLDTSDMQSDTVLVCDSVNVNTKSTQTPRISINTKPTQTPHIFKLLSNDALLSDSKSVMFYTGLENIEKFKLVFSTLLPMANHLLYRGSQVINVSVEDQFLLMLIKLRRNKEDFELAKLFAISTTEVGNIFVTWINFVYNLWSLIDIWPSRSLVDYYMPALFKRHHPTTRVIVDGTEIPITKPKNPTAQQATFSSYKHQNTIKFLVGATPGGLISFCSEGYAGSTSDRQMTERSTLLTKCDELDSIMADRGFNVQDLFEHKNVSINMPTFLKGRTQLPGIKLKHDRKIASNRIHIERLIGLIKTYKILKTSTNPFYVPMMSRIFFICLMLCNFREGIVK